MPHTVKRIAKGNTAKVNAYAGPAGELVMDTTTNDLVLETGTAGGVRMAKASTAIAASNGITISAGGTLGQATTISGVDASVSAKGVVQLNNATNSTAQNQAATPKAVSDALQAAKDYADTAAGVAYTGTAPINVDASAHVISAADATVAAKGVVQLNNATNSAAQNQAATPKAVSDALQAAKDYADTAAGGATPNVSNATGILPIANGGTGSSTQNFVDLSSAQTVAGVKTLTANPTIKNTGPAITLQQTDITKGTNPSANQSTSVVMVDSAGTANANRTGLLTNSVSTAGLTSTVLYAYQFASGSTANAFIAVYCSADGTQKYATAPTPAAGDNSTKIATTAWVAANAPSFSGTVTQKATRTTTGNWTITGLVIGKPLFLIHDKTGNAAAQTGAIYKSISGVVGGANAAGSGSNAGLYMVGGNSSQYGPDVAVFIPTATTAIINISYIYSNGATLISAYQ